MAKHFLVHFLSIHYLKQSLLSYQERNFDLYAFFHLNENTSALEEDSSGSNGRGRQVPPLGSSEARLSCAVQYQHAFSLGRPELFSCSSASCPVCLKHTENAETVVSHNSINLRINTTNLNTEQKRKSKEAILYWPEFPPIPNQGFSYGYFNTEGISTLNFFSTTSSVQ